MRRFGDLAKVRNNVLGGLCIRNGNNYHPRFMRMNGVQNQIIGGIPKNNRIAFRFGLIKNIRIKFNRNKGNARLPGGTCQIMSIDSKTDYNQVIFQVGQIGILRYFLFILKIDQPPSDFGRQAGAYNSIGYGRRIGRQERSKPHGEH